MRRHGAGETSRGGSASRGCRASDEPRASLASARGRQELGAGFSDSFILRRLEPEAAGAARRGGKRGRPRAGLHCARRGPGSRGRWAWAPLRCSPAAAAPPAKRQPGNGSAAALGENESILPCLLCLLSTSSLLRVLGGRTLKGRIPMWCTVHIASGRALHFEIFSI